MDIPQTHREFFLISLELAKKFGLQYEFIEWYKLERKRGENVMDAAYYARLEWDF